MTAPYVGPGSMLERRLSVERLAPYRRAAGGNLTDALRLYDWNSMASGAVYELLGRLEVVLRNALDQRLQDRHALSGRAGDWWDDPGSALDDKRREDVRRARERVRNQPITHGRVLAELSFGFWRFLLARRYESTLWTPTLRHAFPELRPARRESVYRPLDDLYGLRNRIAHHEPIHSVNLEPAEDDALFLVGRIEPELTDWLRATSRLAEVLVRRPAVG